MATRQKLDTILTLDSIESTGVDFFPRHLLIELFRVNGIKICDRTLSRYRDKLIELKIPNFEYQFYSKGYQRYSAECLWQYAQFVKLMRSQMANVRIKKHMEKFFNE